MPPMEAEVDCIKVTLGFDVYCHSTVPMHFAHPVYVYEKEITAKSGCIAHCVVYKASSFYEVDNFQEN